MAKVANKSRTKAPQRGSKPGEHRGGRKKGTLNKATASVREIARKYAPDVIERLGWLARNAESETAQIAAGREILDRAYGKSPQPMTGEDGEGAVRIIVETGVPRAGRV